ncbi:MAG: methyltransferase family protein [Terriglobales bacterium]
MVAPSSLTLAPAGERIVFWVNFYAWCGVEAWVWMRERKLHRGQRQDRGSVLWIVLWVWAGIWAGFFAMYNVDFSALGHAPLGWLAAGVVLTWLGAGFRLWAIRTLGAFFRVRVEIQVDHQIVMHGPYRWIRNPAYSGATITMLGIGLTMRNWLSVICCVAGILIAYARRIAVEQKALEAHFGTSYLDYIRRTWALIPFLW